MTDTLFTRTFIFSGYDIYAYIDSSYLVHLMGSRKSLDTYIE